MSTAHRLIFFIIIIASSAALFSTGCSSSEKRPDGGTDAGADGGIVFEYDNPVLKASPWPMFRRTTKNNGRSPVKQTASGVEPWVFKTEKGIFHAPAIGGDGTVYIGSADTNFYAISRDGKEKWRFKTGEIIDSSAVLNEDGTIYVPSGDGNFYSLSPDGKEKWRVTSPGQSGYITWWEGHATMDKSGVLYAGNDDYHLYSLSRDGKITGNYKMNDQVWSCAAFGKNGEIFVGSNDLMMHSFNQSGEQIRTWLTMGPVTSSPAVSDSGGMIYFGSFDGYIYGVKPSSEEPSWKYPARDHIYGSAAVAEDGTVYIGSADGTLYAITPDGKLKWAFDTLDPIRSSPAIDGDGTIYFGGADGTIYAVNPDGTRKWSYDTTETDRNDLNGSPAVSFDGIVIGGEAGNIYFIPFDHCTWAGAPDRCRAGGGEDIPSDGALLYYYTPGGSSRETVPVNLPPTSVLPFRLVVRKGGDTVAARIDPASAKVSAEPSFPFRTEISANGQFMNVIPLEPLKSGMLYNIALSGSYLTGGTRVGNKVTGGEVTGAYSKSFNVATRPDGGTQPPFIKSDQEVTVMRMKRLAVPQPPMMTTFNQIGFDSYNYLLGIVGLDKASRKFTMLAVEGTPGMDPVIYQNTKSIFTIDGSFQDSAIGMTGSGFKLDVSGVGIAMDLFRIGGVLGEDLKSGPLNIYAEVTCKNIQSFGPVLDMLGLCNPVTGKMILNGTALLEPHPGTEGKRPAGLSVVAVTYHAPVAVGDRPYVEAAFSGGGLDPAAHLPVIVLTDPATGKSVSLDYGGSSERVSSGGVLAGTKLYLPAGFDPVGKKAVVTVDLFPVFEAMVQ